MTTTGECFCGAISYEYQGVLRDARSCHCSRCRKAFSAQASAYALVDAAEFRWVTGSELLTSYINQQGFGLQFCSVCGSTLCGVFNGEIHGVTLGCTNGEPDVQIGRHIFIGSKANWEQLPTDIVAYDEAPPTT